MMLFGLPIIDVSSPLPDVGDFGDVILGDPRHYKAYFDIVPQGQPPNAAQVPTTESVHPAPSDGCN